MTRATISDIAQQSGVSTATVDRALNGRNGVSPANRQRVFRAARQLGYIPSEGSIPLPARPAKLEFLIPIGSNSFLQDVAGSIRHFADEQPLVAHCSVRSLDGIGPDALIDGLDLLSPDTDGIGVVTTDHPRSREALSRVCEAGIRVVTLVSDVSATPRSDYIGVDNVVAGRTAAQIFGMMNGAKGGSVAVFCGSHTYNGHHQREAGFRACLSENYPNLVALQALETGEDEGRLDQSLSRLLRIQPDLVGVYCAGAGQEGLLQALENMPLSERPFVILHDLTDHTRRWLSEDRIDAVIDQNACLIGEQAVLRLLGAVATGPAKLPVQFIEPRIILRENIPAGPVRD